MDARKLRLRRGNSAPLSTEHAHVAAAVAVQLAPILSRVAELEDCTGRLLLALHNHEVAFQDIKTALMLTISSERSTPAKLSTLLENMYTALEAFEDTGSLPGLSKTMLAHIAKASAAEPHDTNETIDTSGDFDYRGYPTAAETITAPMIDEAVNEALAEGRVRSSPYTLMAEGMYGSQTGRISAAVAPISWGPLDGPDFEGIEERPEDEEDPAPRFERLREEDDDVISDRHADRAPQPRRRAR